MEYYLGYILSGMAIIISVITALVAQVKVNNAFNKYKDVPSSLNMTGRELAEKLSQDNNLGLIVRECQGSLTDHYDPRDKSINISQSNFNNNSIASQAIVAHEFGHAMQDAEGYAPYKVRQVVVKVSNLVSRMLMPLLIIGILLQVFLMGIAGSLVIYISVAIYAVAVIANLVTLPVEINASSRAKDMLVRIGAGSDEEVQATDKVLNAAALTYVASLMVSLAYFLRFLFLLLMWRRD